MVDGSAWMAGPPVMAGAAAEIAAVSTIAEVDTASRASRLMVIDVGITTTANPRLFLLLLFF